MKPGQLLWGRKNRQRLAAAKKWQEEEREAARGRILELAETTPEYDPRRDERSES